MAEKFQAMVAFGIINSPIKDFYDVLVLSQQEEFDGETRCRALIATFGNRRTPLPASTPLAFTEEFYGDPRKEAAWSAFLRRYPPGGGYRQSGGHRA